MDHFARLGLPRSAAVDAADLERRYVARSREVHPDLAGDDALVEAAALNDAYRVLADPWRRYAYLAELLCPGVMERTKSLCPVFLAETMERFEAAQAADSEEGRAAIAAEVEGRLADHGRRIEVLLRSAAGAQEAAVLCHEARYFRRLLETVVSGAPAS